MAHVAAEIGVSEQVLGEWVAQAKARADGDDDRVSMWTSVENSSGYARRMPNCV
ncbi:hypothetical protein H5400_03180 [Rhodococcus wratislaviensis]|nr:hypothetical protein [Rhodococcus sp. 3A]MBC2897339.1 hypothetical protein [Rhodococcus sp. 4CII]